MDLNAAIITATSAHAGQLDKQDAPYILHPLRVMLNVPERCRVVAVLHDVIEDTKTTMARLAGMGLTLTEQRALRLVTRPPATAPARPTYKEWIMEIVDAEGEAGEIARVVKVADIYDNLGRLTPELEGMSKRYTWALEKLAPRTDTF